MKKKRKVRISRETFESMIEAGYCMATCIYNLLQCGHKLSDSHTAKFASKWQRKWDEVAILARHQDNQ